MRLYVRGVLDIVQIRLYTQKLLLFRIKNQQFRIDRKSILGKCNPTILIDQPQYSPPNKAIAVSQYTDFMSELKFRIHITIPQIPQLF